MITSRRDFLKLSALLPALALGNKNIILALGAPIVSIAEFGADGSGMDATVPLQLAIAALGDYGGIVFFPPGDFPVSQVVMSTKPVMLLASGLQSTIIRATTAVDDVLVLDYPGCKIVGLRMSRIATRTGGNYIRLTPNSNNAIITDCYLRYYHGGIKIETGATVHVERTSLRDGMTGPGTYAMHLGAGNDYHVNEVTIDNPAGQPEAGIVVDGAMSLQMKGCNIMRSGKAMWIKRAYSPLVENSFFDSSVEGLYIKSDNGPIVRAKFLGCGISSHSNRGVTVLQGAGGIVDDIQIDDATVFENGWDGVYFGGGSKLRLSNSTINKNGGSGLLVGGLAVDKFSINDNFIQAHLGAGVWNLAGNVGAAFRDNTITGNGVALAGNPLTLGAGNIVI